MALRCGEMRVARSALCGRGRRDQFSTRRPHLFAMDGCASSGSVGSTPTVCSAVDTARPIFCGRPPLAPHSWQRIQAVRMFSPLRSPMVGARVHPSFNYQIAPQSSGIRRSSILKCLGRRSGETTPRNPLVGDLRRITGRGSRVHEGRHRHRCVDAIAGLLIPGPPAVATGAASR
jgi:hypothetical protein